MAHKPEISICIACKNRSRIQSPQGVLELFPECVRTLRQSAMDAGMVAELVVTDFMSTDWPIEEWLPEAWYPFTSVVVNTPALFTLGLGKNLAAEHAYADTLFFCETDMLVPPHVFTQGMKVVARGEGYFPEYQRFKGADRVKDELRWGNGHGVCVVRREHWQHNRWKECLGWGCGEDDAFADWFVKRSKEAREKVSGFYHMWHPLVSTKTMEDEENKP